MKGSRRLQIGGRWRGEREASGYSVQTIVPGRTLSRARASQARHAREARRVRYRLSLKPYRKTDDRVATSISARYTKRKWHCTVAPDAFPSLSRPVAEPVQRPGHAVHRPCHTRARQARGAWEHGAAGGSNAVVVNEEHHAMTCAGSTARPEETTYGLKAIAALSVMY